MEDYWEGLYAENRCQTIAFSGTCMSVEIGIVLVYTGFIFNAFLAGGSDDAWADAEDISEEDSALRFVSVAEMRKRELD